VSILDSVLSLASGGITGLVGTAIGSFFTYKSKQLDIELQKEKYANEIELKKADAAIMAQEWAARTQIAETTANAQVETEDAKGFTASLTSEPQRYAEGTLTKTQNWLMVFLDFFRGIIRPSLTLYLSALTTLVYLQARSLINSGMSPEQAINLTSKIIDTVLYLTSTSILWYFGSRIHDKVRK